MRMTRRKFVTKALMTLGLTVFLAVFGLFLTAAPPAAAQSVEITLLHISDTHSHLAAWGPKDANLDGTLGGLPKVAAIVATERTSDPNALFVHAGDLMDGDFFFNEYLGVPEFQLLKSIGLDALVLGNHEFRFGPDFLANVLQAAWTDPGNGVPILGTNLQIPADNALLPWVRSTLIKDVEGVKVGFFGLLTPSDAISNPDPVEVLDYVCPIAQAAVDQLRASGAQVVVCLSHAGLSAARMLAGCVSGIDVIVNGHDNAVLAQPESITRLGGGVTLIVSAGNHYRWVGRLRLSVDGDQVSLVDYALLSADAGTLPSPEMQAAVDALKPRIVARYGDVYHQPLAWAEQDITLTWDPRHAKRDTPLGNLFADAYRDWTGTDIAVEPFAYMGDPLPAGTIVGADIFRSMSYGNLKVTEGQQIARPWRLVTFRTTGSALIDVLEKTLSYGGDFFPQVSGMRFDYDPRLLPLHRILLDTVHVRGRELVADQLYSVTVTEGVYLVLRYYLGVYMQDIQTLPVLAFDAARTLVALRGELGLATSNRIRDVAAIPGRKR